LSCSKENIIIRKSEILTPFDSIELAEGLELIFEEDSVFSIEITGYAKQIEKLRYVVDNKNLRIINLDKTKWRNPKRNKIVIQIKALPLKLIIANDGCNVSSKNKITSKEFGLVIRGKVGEASLELNCETFYFWNDFPSGGLLTLKGQVEILKLWNVGLMSIDASLLSANYAEIENTSKGDCTINVVKRLTYKIGGSGNLNLFGNPEIIHVDVNKKSGNLIRL
jgi:hypothetical protein